MSTFLLAAGEATRLGGSCKAMTLVGDRPMVDWWRDALGAAPTVICRSVDLPWIPIHIPAVTCDEGGGPARALSCALEFARPAEPVTVIYADTWLPALPDITEFCAVAKAKGGRKWDIYDEGGYVTYEMLPAGEEAWACVGAYRFADPFRLRLAVDSALEEHGADGAEVGMGDVVNRYGVPFVPVKGWQDVGDHAAVARWRPL